MNSRLIASHEFDFDNWLDILCINSSQIKDPITIMNCHAKIRINPKGVLRLDYTHYNMH